MVLFKLNFKFILNLGIQFYFFLLHAGVLLLLGSIIRKNLQNCIKENETKNEDKVQIEETEKNYIKELFPC